MNTKRQLGRAFVVVGYSLVAVGAVILSVFNLSQSYLGADNPRAVLDYVANPLSLLAGLFAWWFLSALVVTEDRQVALVRRAFVGLSIQALATSITFFIVVTSGIGLSWPNASFWLDAIGQVSAAVGFFVIYLSYRLTTIPTPDLYLPENAAHQY